MKIGKKIILGFLTVLVLTGLIAKIALKFQDKLLNLNISREILEKEKLSDVFIRNEMRALSSALEVFVQDQTIKDLYLEKDREKLYQHGKILFEDISTKYGITHVYFILPDGHCFLRLHDKDLYNDKITRVTFEKARDTKTMVSGVELGKTAFALRVVKPYYNGNELIGYVEFGEEINIFLNNLKDSLISENLLIVNKRFLDKEKWSAMRKIEGLEDNWNDFGEHVLVNNIEGIFLEKIKKYIGANINILVKGKVVVEEIEIGNKSFYLGGFHFKDVKGEEVGVLFILLDVTDVLLIAKKGAATLLFIFTIGFVLIMGIGLYISHSISAPINKLKEVTVEIGRGSLNVKIDIVSKDEIGELAASFVEMTKNLRETVISRNYLDNIFQSMTDYLIVINVEGKITTINKAFFDNLGYNKESLIGRDVSSLFFEGDRYFNSVKIEEYIQKGSLINFEAQICGKNGIIVPVLLSSSVIREIDCPRGYPVEDCQNYTKSGKHCENNKGIVFLAKDVTDLKKAESELLLSNAELATSLEMSELLLNDLKQEKQIVIQAQQAISKVNQELIANEKALNNMMADLIKTNEELKNTQAQLVQSEKLSSLGQLSAGIAHEINNPLGFIDNNIVILGEYIDSYSEVLRAMDLLKKAIVSKDLDRAVSMVEEINVLEEKVNLSFISGDIENLIRQSKNGTDRIKKIVQDLRTFARKDEGQIELNNVEDIIDSVLSIVWNEIKYKAELIKEYGEIPLVKCNAQKLGQVFINLLVNAAQAIKEKGVITIKTYTSSKNVVIEISDTGSGIAKEHITKIFDPFF
ncbi:MAG: PAS domain S-box protein, partial [Candidatus Omnitrophica bacterium]|nr:PAS domain S-box protein [Candidatus Omnitrophota bacterium]